MQNRGEENAMGLFGQLYDWYKEEHIVHNQEEFLRLVFGNDTAYSINSPNYFSHIFKQDIPHGFIEDRLKSFTDYDKMFRETTNKDTYKDKLITILSEQRDEIEDTKISSSEYNLVELNRLITHIEKSDIYKDFFRITYNFLYWCFIKRLAVGFSFNAYEQNESDLQEYIDKILHGLGSSGMPGTGAIYAMAERKNPNIYALFEAGEMEYYGKNACGVRDFQSAFRYYLKAKNSMVAHPLALWSLGYMLYYYQVPGKELESADIEEIENMIQRDAQTGAITDSFLRYETAINYLTEADRNSCAAAGNVLSVITSDPNVPESLKKGLKTREEYLVYSAKAGYPFAKTNLARLYLEKAKKTKSLQIRDDYIEKCRINIIEAADTGEPWAANYLARQYNEGFSEFLNGENIEIFSIDKEKALYYFTLSEKCGGYRNASWAIWNLVESFSDHFSPEVNARRIEGLKRIQDETIKKKLEAFLSK